MLTIGLICIALFLSSPAILRLIGRTAVSVFDEIKQLKTDLAAVQAKLADPAPAAAVDWSPVLSQIADLSTKLQALTDIVGTPDAPASDDTTAETGQSA